MKRDSLKCNAIANYIVDSNPPKIEKISGEHCHGADILHDYVGNKENILIKAAAAVGNAVTARVFEEIKAKFITSFYPVVCFW